MPRILRLLRLVFEFLFGPIEDAPPLYPDGSNDECPVCKGTSLECGSVNVGDDCAHQEMSCADCGSSWADSYLFTGRIIYSRGE